MITSELYRAALACCEYLVALDPEKDSPEGKLLRTLAAAVENYERENFPNLFGKPTSAEEAKRERR